VTEQYEKCQTLAEKLILEAKENGNTRAEARFYLSLGNMNYNHGNKPLAEKYYQKALLISIPHQYHTISGNCYNNLGAIRLENGIEDDTTEHWLLLALETSGKARPIHQNDIARHLRILSLLYVKQKKYAKAEAIYQKLILQHRQDSNEIGLIGAMIFYSELLMEQKKHDLALNLTREALSKIEKYNDLHMKSLVYEYHSYHLYNMGIRDSAYHYMRLVKDILQNQHREDINKKTAEAEAKFRNVEIEYEKNLALLKAKKRNQLILLGSLCTIIISSLGFWLFHQRKKREMEMQNIQAVMAAEESERERIARDLHDGIGQLLSATTMNLQAYSRDLSPSLLEKITALVSETAKEVRSVSHQIMPNALLKSGLVSAVKNFIDQIDHDKLKIYLETSGLKTKINEQTSSVVYRIIQECINNVIKHSEANQLFITLEVENNMLNLMVEDNGKGFDVDKALKKDGIGLQNMQARVNYIRGTMEIDSKIGHGTVFSFHIPLAS